MFADMNTATIISTPKLLALLSEADEPNSRLDIQAQFQLVAQRQVANWKESII
jgi:hypothetical protein